MSGRTTLEVQTTVEDSGGVVIQQLATDWRPADVRGEGWVDVEAGQIEVPSAGCKVVARIWKHSGSWVGTIDFDSVRFERLG